MSEYLIYRKPIDNVGQFRIYTRFDNRLHTYLFRFELWVYKDMDSNTINLGSIGDDYINTMCYMLMKNVDGLYMFPIANPLTRNAFREFGKILYMEVNRYVSISTPADTTNIMRGIYSSAYGFNLEI